MKTTEDRFCIPPFDTFQVIESFFLMKVRLFELIGQERISYIRQNYGDPKEYFMSHDDIVLGEAWIEWPRIGSTNDGCMAKVCCRYAPRPKKAKASDV